MDPPPTSTPDEPPAGGSAPPQQAGLHVGALIGGRYRLERRLASGGMATVWEGVDEVLTRRVAVKVLHPHLAADTQFVHRFRREAVAVAGLAHPSVVSIFDTCSDGDVEAIVMELVRGPTLRQELDQRGRIDPAEAIAIVAEIADALRAAHDAGIVHRDVKPGNVLLSADGRVLVADFGIAQASDGLELTGAGTTLGTAKYLSPEQVEGRPVDARADIYAAGVLLYELVCGQAPFVADTELATALARVQRDPVPPRQLRPDLAPNLESIILKALARDPAQRFQHAADLRDALRAAGRWSASSPPGGGATPAPPPAVQPAPTVPPPPAPVGEHTMALQTGDHTMANAGLAAAAAGGGATAATTHAAPARPARRRRRWGLGITLLLVLTAAGIAVALALQAGDPRPPRDPFTRDPAEPGATVTGISTFDPPNGDGEENDEDAPLAIDGDASTAWRSECYRRASAFPNLKAGVGLILALDATADIAAVRVAGAPPGWNAQVHVADEPAATLEGWGPPVGAVTGAGEGTTDIALDGATGSHVLVFFTGLPPDPTEGCPGGNPFAISVAELAIDED